MDIILMEEKRKMDSFTWLQINGFTPIYGHGMTLEVEGLKYLYHQSFTILD